jgi:hypothetical protein
MKDDSIVEAFRDELLDMGDMIGREVGTKLDDDRPFRRLKRQGVGGFGH